MLGGEVVKTIVVVGKSGRIVIPHKIREIHEIQEGDAVRIISHGKGLDLTIELLETK
jgi:AbrB family looped-hinge helix DNA binding protein